MIRWIVVCLAMLGLVPLQAMADRMSYSFIQAQYVFDSEIEQGGADADGDAPGVRFGWIMGPYLFSDIRWEEYDYDGGVDGHEASAALGFRHPLMWPVSNPGMRLDWFGTLSFEDLDLDPAFDETGWAAGLGLRFSPVKWVELAGKVNRIDYGSQDGLQWIMDLHLNTSRYFAFVFQYREMDLDVPSAPDIDKHDTSVGMRFMFGGG